MQRARILHGTHTHQNQQGSSWESILLNAKTIGSKHYIVAEASLIKQFKYAFNSCLNEEQREGKWTALDEDSEKPWKVQGVKGV